MSSEAFETVLKEVPRGILITTANEVTYVPTYAACDSVLQYWAGKIPPWKHQTVKLSILLPSRRVDISFHINSSDEHIQSHKIAKDMTWHYPGLN